MQNNELGMMNPPSNNRLSAIQLALMPGIAGIVILLDQLSKYLVEALLPLYRSWSPIELIPALRISHVSNSGSAFGLFPAQSQLFAWAALFVAIGIVIYNFKLGAGQTPLRFALGLQLGGALGNLIDRLRMGHVTDFIDFGPWVFNLADVAIILGALMLAWVLWQESGKHVPDPRQIGRKQTQGAYWDEQPSN